MVDCLTFSVGYALLRRNAKSSKHAYVDYYVTIHLLEKVSVL